METQVTGKPMIAIVDDDESVRDAVSGMVESFGYSADLFESADEFLRSDRLEGTSCLILDVQMPGTSGLELHNRLISAGHRIPTIFVTAFPDTRVRDRAMLAGAVCFLPKPFARDKLFGCINAALESRSPG
jgi:FixJ family two-component response regulator